MRNFECSGHQILCDGEPWAWIDSAKWGEDFDIAQFLVDAANEKERREAGTVYAVVKKGKFVRRVTAEPGKFVTLNPGEELMELE